MFELSNEDALSLFWNRQVNECIIRISKLVQEILPQIFLWEMRFHLISSSRFEFATLKKSVSTMVHMFDKISFFMTWRYVKSSAQLFLKLLLKLTSAGNSYIFANTSGPVVWPSQANANGEKRFRIAPYLLSFFGNLRPWLPNSLIKKPSPIHAWHT